MTEILRLDSDAFSDGQIGSKLWLCEKLEELHAKSLIPHEPRIWILGGWYGVLAFMIMARDRIRPVGIRSFDQDSDAGPIADKLNNHWEFQSWKFKSHTVDVNELSFKPVDGFGPEPQLVINTSCEHFDSDIWFERIPSGTAVVLQATDMEIPDHVNRPSTIVEFENRFSSLSKILFSGQKSFIYPNTKFTRFMIIGLK